jgi:SNF2 family DNA or RNA helicase
MSGTVMQNNHDELWSVVELVQPGYLGEWDLFEQEYAVPLKLARYVFSITMLHSQTNSHCVSIATIRVKDAKEDIIRRGEVLKAQEIKGRCANR